MQKHIPEKLMKLARAAPFDLFLVGGSVRDFLCGRLQERKSVDWDICAPVLFEEFVFWAEKEGFTVHSAYKNTGTVKLTDADGVGYEFSAFRSDEYIRGEHRPSKIYFTDDIRLDARRRDFTCNAVYYHLREGKTVDPLSGVEDIKNRIMRTVREATKVFSEDGLRLMRLARQCAQLGFSVEQSTMEGAKQNARLILDIAPERIFTELELLLAADQKYGEREGHYKGLCVLRDTGVLPYILPELAKGQKMAQRADFHRYDVLEHTFRAVLYAKPNVRLAALLHDVGKPFCMERDGNVHEHPVEGKRLTREILTRLKASKKKTERTAQLVFLHMYDMDCKTKESKVRRFLALNQDLLPDLWDLMQADFSACQDDLSVSPPRAHLEAVYRKMLQENAPMRLKALKIDGKDLLQEGIPPAKVGEVLQELWLTCVVEPRFNEKKHLLKTARGMCFGKKSRRKE